MAHPWLLVRGLRSDRRRPVDVAYLMLVALRIATAPWWILFLFLFRHRLRVICQSSLSTGGATAPPPGPQLPSGGSYPSDRHNGSVCAAPHDHNHVGPCGYDLAAAPPATPPDPLPAPSSRDFAVLPPASTVGPLEHWPHGGSPGQGLGAGDPQGARRDTLSAAAEALVRLGVARSSNVHPSARGRVELEHGERVFRRSPVSAVDLSERWGPCGWPC